MTLAVRGRALRALLALPLLAVPASVQASGFAIESQGSRAMGFAGAYVAQAADPSAIFYNAAGIGFLKGKQLYVGGAFVGRSDRLHRHGPQPARGHARELEQRPGSAPLDLLLAAGGRQDGGRPGREPAVRQPLGVGQPRHVHRPLHLPRVPDRLVVDQPHDRVQAGRPLLDRRGRRHPPLELQALAPADRRPQPVPRAHRRRRADARQRHRHRGRLQRRPAGDADREPLDRALLPSRGDDRPRRAGQLRADPHREHRARPGGGDRAARLAARDRQLHLPRPASRRASRCGAATGRSRPTSSGCSGRASTRSRSTT